MWRPRGGISLLIDGDSLVQISDVDFSGGDHGLYLANIDGLVLDHQFGTGLDSVYWDALALHNVHNSVISSLDLSWGGEGAVGTGVWIGDGILATRSEMSTCKTARFPSSCTTCMTR